MIKTKSRNSRKSRNVQAKSKSVKRVQHRNKKTKKVMKGGRPPFRTPSQEAEYRKAVASMPSSLSRYGPGPGPRYTKPQNPPQYTKQPNPPQSTKQQYDPPKKY